MGWFLNPITTASGTPSVTLVIPVYNEAHRLAASIRALREFLAPCRFSYEVFLVIERSTDGTLELARELTAGQEAFRVIGNEDQRGKGHAVRTGMMAARGDIAFFMDADLSTPLVEIDRFLAHFSTHPEIDILIGNRQHPASAIMKRQSWLRQKMGQTFNVILRTTARIRVKDTQCGFKAFRRVAREAIFARQKIEGFAFDVELLILAERLGHPVADLPVEWHNAEGSKVHMIRDSWRMLRDAIRIRSIVEQTLREKGLHDS